MKKAFILGLTTVGFILGSMTASAASDSKYPASDFQPKVIFADKELTAKAVQKSEFDPKYPAASFEPTIVYADQDLIAQAETATKKTVRKTEFDPRYPAANFEPKVIYP